MAEQKKDGKNIAEDRKAADKLALQQLEVRQRFVKTESPSAKEARSMTESSGGPTIDAQAAAAWATVMKLVKDQATEGKSFAQVPVNASTHPDLKAIIIKKLDNGGYKHDLVNGSAYIYW